MVVGQFEMTVAGLGPAMAIAEGSFALRLLEELKAAFFDRPILASLAFGKGRGVFEFDPLKAVAVVHFASDLEADESDC